MQNVNCVYRSIAFCPFDGADVLFEKLFYFVSSLQKMKKCVFTVIMNCLVIEQNCILCAFDSDNGVFH